MKTLAILLTFITVVFAGAHEIEGVASYKGTKLPSISRARVPFVSSFKEDGGRTYVLWIAPDGAIAFHIKVKLMDKDLAPLTYLWMIHTKDGMKLPAGFETRSLIDKSKINGVEALKGPFRVDWGNDLDYTIFLDVKSPSGTHAFKGYLYGDPRNKKI